jgi:hypothetical protein
MRRWAVAAAASAAVAASIGVRAELAFACSCARQPASALVERADAAFVGTVRSRRVESPSGPLSSSGDPAVLVFDVEHVAKGRLPRMLSVTTVASSASCGLEAERGTRLGLVIDRNGREWRGSLCGQLGPEALIRAGVPGAGFVDSADDDRGLLAPALAVCGVLAALALTWWYRRTRRG